jgi:predicted acetyltransferase
MRISIRPTEPHEYRQAATAFMTALMEAPHDDEAWERRRAGWDGMPSFSAGDATLCVGHASNGLVDTTVPGGARLPTSAVTRVGILPTHRRQGIATGLMQALIDDARTRDLVLMSLRASEAVIYGRFGFGIAGDHTVVTIDPAKATPLFGTSDGGTFRILEPTEIVDVTGPLYEQVAHRRPGVITRPVAWQARLLRSAVERTSASFVAVHSGADGRPDGYVHYTVAWSEGPTQVTAGEGEVHDLWGTSDGVELALWRYVFELDLVTVWKSRGRPVDDLLRWAVADPRSYQQVAVQDEQWLRLIDVDLALSGRTYNAASGSVTIQITDPLIEPNNGTWRISADGAERTDHAPDLRVGIETISAAYLGGPSWATLVGTGAVEVFDQTATATADTLFASRPLPHCGTFF